METVLKIHVYCDGESKTREFTLFPVRVGREHDCELQLGHPFVSRHHARIERSGDGLVLVAEGSRNGIVCDGRRLAPHERAPLVDGSEIRISRLVARVQLLVATEFAPERPTDKATSLYADHAIDPAIVDRVGAAIDACTPATQGTLVESVNAALGGSPLRATSGRPDVAPRMPQTGTCILQRREGLPQPAAVGPGGPQFLRELQEAALSYMPEGPAVTSPNVDALLDGLEGVDLLEIDRRSDVGPPSSALGTTGSWIAPAGVRWGLWRGFRAIYAAASWFARFTWTQLATFGRRTLPRLPAAPCHRGAT